MLSKSCIFQTWVKCMPAVGAGNALLFSVNIMNPSLFNDVFAPRQLFVANSIWLKAHFGIGIYLYNRRHLACMSKTERVMYSVYGTCLFNFGSVLFWATTKNLLPESNALRMLVGITSGVAFLAIGRRYLLTMDELAN